MCAPFGSTYTKKFWFVHMYTLCGWIIQTGKQLCVERGHCSGVEHSVKVLNIKSYKLDCLLFIYIHWMHLYYGRTGN